MAIDIKIENPFIVKVTRDFDFSIEQVFDAWLDPDSLGNWFFATPDSKGKKIKIDPQVGGGFEIGEQRGDEFANHIGTYHLIERPNKIVFSYYYETENEEMPSIVTVDFIKIDKGCSLTVTHEMDNIYSVHEESAIEGWNMIFDGLHKTL